MARTNDAEYPLPPSSIEPPPLPSQPLAAYPTHTDQPSHPHSDRPPSALQPRFNRASTAHLARLPRQAHRSPQTPTKPRHRGGRGRPQKPQNGGVEPLTGTGQPNLPTPADPHAKRHPQPPSKTGRTDRRGIPAPASFDGHHDLKTAPPFAHPPTPRRGTTVPAPTRQQFNTGTSLPSPLTMQPHHTTPNRATVPRHRPSNFIRTDTLFNKHALPRSIPARPILPNQRNPRQAQRLAALNPPPELTPPCEGSPNPKLPATNRILRNQPVILQNQRNPARHRAEQEIILRNQRRILTNKHDLKSTHRTINTSKPTQAHLHQRHSTRPDTANPPPLRHLQPR